MKRLTDIGLARACRSAARLVKDPELSAKLLEAANLVDTIEILEATRFCGDCNRLRLVESYGWRTVAGNRKRLAICRPCIEARTRVFQEAGESIEGRSGSDLAVA